MQRRVAAMVIPADVAYGSDRDERLTCYARAEPNRTSRDTLVNRCAWCAS